MTDDYDSPWKEALDTYFAAFMAFLFPHAHAEIDWSRTPQSLDKELQQITPDAASGRRIVDKLVKVWRITGEAEWVLVHIEVQAERDAGFAKRMFIYNTRLYDRYNRDVASLAVLGDRSFDWRPEGLTRGLWGCRTEFRFPVVKLGDYASRQTWLESNDNPFARVVLAHLKTQETRRDPTERCRWKIRIVKGLYDDRMSPDDIRQLFRFIDWLMNLPEDLGRAFWNELSRFEEEKHVSYMTTPERLGREEGLKQGLEQGLEQGEQRGLKAAWLRAIEIACSVRCASDTQDLMARVREIQSTDELATLFETLERTASPEEFAKRIRGLPLPEGQ